nr:zinc ribbon domain-containing protein [Candidatus Sigynarchaeota archaeon]
MILAILIGTGQIIQSSLLGLVVLAIIGIVIPIIYWVVKASAGSRPSKSPSYGQPTPQYYNPPTSQAPVPAWETGNVAPANLPVTPSAPAAQGIACPFCGAMNPQNAAFCGNCAAALRKNV